MSKAKRTHFKSYVTDSCMHTDRTAQKPKFIVVPYSPILNSVKKPLRLFNTKLVFAYKNKLMNKLINNKPKTDVSCGGNRSNVKYTDR